MADVQKNLGGYKLGKTLDCIKLAVSKGYKALEDGSVIGPRGKPLNIKIRGKQKYATFCINSGDDVFGIPVHQFNAYCFYGEKPLNCVVRHLDGNSSNNSKINLRYGTHSENNLDKAKETRVNAARKARQSRNEEDFYKLSIEQREYIGLLYNSVGDKAPNGFATWLAKMFQVNRNTIARIGKKYRQLLTLE